MAKKITLKKLRRRNKRFYMVYFIALAVFALAVLVACTLVKDVLAEYEQSQPEHEAEKVAQIFLDRDFENVYPWEDETYLDGASLEEYVSFMNENTEGMEITWRKKITADSVNVTYAVYADGMRFGTFVLSPAEKTRHGFSLWALSSMETTIFVHETESAPEPVYGAVRVQADSRSTVTVNGETLDESSIVEKDIPTEAAGHMPAGVAAPTDVIYEAKVTGDADVSVTDHNGKAQAVSLVKGVYVAAVNYEDEALRPAREEWISKLAQAVAKYFTKNISLQTLTRRVEENSKAYESLAGFDTNYLKENIGQSFANMKTFHYLTYASNCFSCDVQFEYIVKYYGAEKTYESAYRFYFRKVDDLWMLYDFEIIDYQK